MHAAASVLSSRQAMVIGPPPPGTGVIATARARKIVVVTEEGSRGNKNRPKIPLACQHFKVEGMTILDYIERQGWTFS